VIADLRLLGIERDDVELSHGVTFDKKPT
jgi:hypothetical protein